MDGVQGLANYIANAIKKANRGGQTYQAQVIGGAVRVNGTTMPYVAAVDVTVDDGDYVFVVLDESGRNAVVVGK